MRTITWLPPDASITLVGLSWVRKQPQPVAVLLTFTVPAKPPTLVRVMVDVLDVPDWRERLEGLAEIVKPSTSAVTFTDLAPAPVPPVTVTM